MGRSNGVYLQKKLTEMTERFLGKDLRFFL